MAPVCCPRSGLNRDDGCSLNPSKLLAEPLLLRAASKIFLFSPSRPTAPGSWGSASHGLRRVKENKNEPQIQEGKNAGMQNIELNHKYEASV